MTSDDFTSFYYVRGRCSKIKIRASTMPQEEHEGDAPPTTDGPTSAAYAGAGQAASTFLSSGAGNAPSRASCDAPGQTCDAPDQARANAAKRYRRYS